VTERRDGLPLLYCHTNKCSFIDLSAALRKLGLWPEGKSEAAPWQRHAQTVNPPVQSTDDDRAKKQEAAQAAAIALWRRSRPITGTLAEIYLRHRGFTGAIPPTVFRFGSCKHRSDGRFYPALVAAVVMNGDVTNGVAVHRTFLRSDGRGKAEVDPDKMTLGPCRGASVPMASASSVVAVAEGIETALSYMQATGTPTWAALSAGGIRNLILPPEISEVVIAADPDPVGMMAARAAARRWLAEGRKVSIARPPLGLDFNDLARRVAV
jgi:phage/plasmid primase-like uncharacterized protein